MDTVLGGYILLWTTGMAPGITVVYEDCNSELVIVGNDALANYHNLFLGVCDVSGVHNSIKAKNQRSKYKKLNCKIRQAP